MWNGSAGVVNICYSATTRKIQFLASTHHSETCHVLCSNYVLILQLISHELELIHLKLSFHVFGDYPASLVKVNSWVAFADDVEGGGFSRHSRGGTCSKEWTAGLQGILYIYICVCMYVYITHSTGMEIYVSTSLL